MEWEYLAFILLVHSVYALMYIQRFNLSVAIVAMVHTTPTPNTTSNNTLGEFTWDQGQQGIVLSAFFFGYIPPQVPGGLLVDRYGGKVVGGVGILMSSLFTLATPLSAYTRSPYTFMIVARACVGLCQGLVYTAVMGLLRKWSPPGAKNRMIAMATSGTDTGSILAFSLGGVMCASTFLGGWPSVFYVFGFVGIISFVAWMIVMKDAPHKYERFGENTETELSIVETRVKVPWTQIFTSPAVWAVGIGNFSKDWVWVFILTALPSYYKQVLGISVQDGGLLSTVPIITALITHTASGFFSDYLQHGRGWSSRTTPGFTALVGFLPTAMLLVLVSYTPEGEVVQAVVVMTLCVGVLRFNRVAFQSNILELSPTFTGVIAGIANTFCVVGSICAPLVTGFVINHHPTRESYRVVFFINAAICVFGGVYFAAFVNTDVQDWDPVSNTNTMELEESRTTGSAHT